MELNMNDAKFIRDDISCIMAALSPLKETIKSDRKSIKSLLHFFSFVKDFRTPGKITYKLENILCICLLISMKGKFTSFYNAAIYIKVKKNYFKNLGLLDSDAVPSHDTLRRIFMYIDSNELRDCLIGRIKEFINKIVNKNDNETKYTLLSGDGKKFNGSGRKDSKNNVNVFNILNASSSVCISSTALDDKESEIKEFQRLLPKYNLANTMVTADAMHCQRKTAEIIVNNKGEYMLTVKDNNPGLREEIDRKMEGSKLTKISFNKCDYEILNLPSSYIGEDYPKQKAYVRMVSHKREGQKDYSPKYQHFITSTNSINLIVEAIDNRWEIEDGLHWFKDDFLKEDECTFTDKNSIQVMATFNNITYALYKIASAIFDDSCMAETRIRFEEHPEKMLYKLIPLMEKQNLSNLLKQNMKGRKGKN